MGVGGFECFWCVGCVKGSTGALVALAALGALSALCALLCELRVVSRELCEQRMSQLPQQIFEVPCRPFTNVTMDFTGAFKVKSLTFPKRHDKVFPLIIVCMNTSAIHTEVCRGYSTQDFLIAFEHFCSIRGQPNFCYTDAGTQLQRAKKEIAEEKGDITDEYPSVVWGEVQKKTAKSGIIWKIAPPGAQNRDGRSEAAVHALKKTLKHLYHSRDINVLEFITLLSKAANCINDRPLAITDTMGGEPGITPITPNLLLHNQRTESAVEDFGKYQDDRNYQDIGKYQDVGKHQNVGKYQDDAKYQDIGDF